MRANLNRGDSSYLDPIAHQFLCCLTCHVFVLDAYGLYDHEQTEHHRVVVGGGGSGGGGGGGGSGGGGDGDGASMTDGHSGGFSDEEDGGRYHGDDGWDDGGGTDGVGPCGDGGAEEVAPGFDWLGRPLDALDFDGDPRIGEVFLLPLWCENWDTEDGLLEGSRNCTSYSRFRVTDVNSPNQVHRHFLCISLYSFL